MERTSALWAAYAQALFNVVLFIPHICHEPHEYIRVKKFWAGVNLFRFNAKIWQFTVYFAVITQKIGNLLCILS